MYIQLDIQVNKTIKKITRYTIVVVSFKTIPDLECWEGGKFCLGRHPFWLVITDHAACILYFFTHWHI